MPIAGSGMRVVNNWEKFLSDLRHLECGGGLDALALEERGDLEVQRVVAQLGRDGVCSTWRCTLRSLRDPWR